MYNVYTTDELLKYLNDQATKNEIKKLSDGEVRGLANACLSGLTEKIHKTPPEKMTNVLTAIKGSQYESDDYDIPVLNFRLIAKRLEEMSKRDGLGMDEMISIMKQADQLENAAGKFEECKISASLGRFNRQALSEESREALIGHSIDFLLNKNNTPTIVYRLVRSLPEEIVPELKTRLEDVEKNSDDIRSRRAKEALRRIGERENDKRKLMEYSEDDSPNRKRDIRYEDCD